MISKKLAPLEAGLRLEVNETLATGSITQLSGLSGSGKTSFLKILAGFLLPDRGHIEVLGTTWLDTSRKYVLQPSKRRCALVFQEYALFKHMTVLGHLRYAGADPAFEKELLEISGLEKHRNNRLDQLSGGQQQRLAIIRALASSPRVLLMDEPFTAQDKQAKLALCTYLARYINSHALSTLVASHQSLADDSDGLLLPQTHIRIEHGKL